MKIFLSLCLIISLSSFAGERKSVATYRFKSDTVNSKVPEGKCLIIGKVKLGEEPLSEGVVSTINHKYSAVTDAKGNYKLLIPAQEVQLYFFKPYHGEIVTHKYDFKSGHKVELDFYAFEDLIMIEVDKPVVYLYSDNEMDVSVDLKPKGELTFSYPVLNEGWKVKVNSNGVFSEGKSYPYLFWEGTQKDLYFQDDKGVVYGDVVQKENVVSFLESQLEKLGLNNVETTDFITFWAPRMVQYEDVLVQFIVDEKYEDVIAEMNIYPQPDAIRRVFMLFSEIDNPKNHSVFPSKKSSEFERTGFTVVEWGGSEIKLKPQITENICE